MNQLDFHIHSYQATDIPAVSICQCGVEIYYASGLQAYYVSVEESDDRPNKR